MKNSYWILNGFIVLFTLFFAGILYPDLFSSFNTPALALIAGTGIIISIINFIKQKRHSTILLVLVLFAFTSVVTTVINIDDLETLPITVIKVLLWIIAFLVAYFISKNSISSLNTFYFLVATLPIMAFLFYHDYQARLAETWAFQGVLLNSAYYLLLLLPVVLAIRQNFIKLAGVFIILSGLIISMKRTGAIAFIMAIIVYFIISYLLRKNTENYKINKTYVFASIFIFLTATISGYIYVSENFNVDWTSRIDTIGTSGGSGRDEIWKSTIKIQLQSDQLNWLMGHGYDKVIIDSPAQASAHNDFLEVLYDYGVVGLGLYFWFIYLLIQYCRKMYKNGFELAAPFAASVTILLILSMGSHLVIYPTYFVYFSIFWGVSIAEYEKWYKNKTIKTEINTKNKMVIT